jgi:hypothetical protein
MMHRINTFPTSQVSKSEEYNRIKTMDTSIQKPNNVRMKHEMQLWKII